MFCGACRQPRDRKGVLGGKMESAGQPRLRRTLGDYSDQHSGWIGGETKAERSKEIPRVTSEPMGEPGLGPSSC